MTVDRLLKHKMPKPKNKLEAAFQHKLKDMINIYELQANIKGVA